MVFMLSPGVHVTEVDLTTIVPTVSVSVGGIGGVFRWGPIEERLMIDSETALVARYGKPTSFNAETWLTAASFLAYGNQLLVSRSANCGGYTPNASFKAVGANDETSNNIWTIQAGTTANLVQGMYIYQINPAANVADEFGNTFNLGIRVSIHEVINTTAIELSCNTMDNSAVTMYFARPGTTYSALGLEPAGIVANLVNQITKNENLYTAVKKGTYDSDVTWLAKYPGEIGNSIRVSQVETAAQFQSNMSLYWTQASNVVTGNVVVDIGSSNLQFIFNTDSSSVEISNSAAANISARLTMGDYLLLGNTSIGQQFAMVQNVSDVVANATHSWITVGLVDPYRLHTPMSGMPDGNMLPRYWEFFNVVDVAPGRSDYMFYSGNADAHDEMHVVVVDEKGLFTGSPGQILEVFKNVSRATDGQNLDGTGNYYVDVINQNSYYIWWGWDRPGAYSNTGNVVIDATTTAPGNYYFQFGSDGYTEVTAPLSVIGTAYDQFTSVEDVDISLIMAGHPLGGTTVQGGETVSNFYVANYIIDNICEVRKDCVAFVSPDLDLILNSYGTVEQSLVHWRDACHDSSYAVIDSGYKYMYDRYNDVFRWVPLNGDIAGLCVRTDQTRDPWWSPAGLNRGQIKNLAKLAWNPRQAQRDVLYPHNINPVVTFPGAGTVLYGDKTNQSRPSAFDRINVRRLFIVLEKAISAAAKYSLFEFNDAFTRAQFRNMVNPYLRTVMGRRGITDFLVVCDETNNTPDVIDRNEFIGDIYIKPNRSINFIQLNFIAVPTGVQFNEVVGKWG